MGLVQSSLPASIYVKNEGGQVVHGLQRLNLQKWSRWLEEGVFKLG